MLKDDKIIVMADAVKLADDIKEFLDELGVWMDGVESRLDDLEAGDAKVR